MIVPENERIDQEIDSDFETAMKKYQDEQETGMPPKKKQKLLNGKAARK